MVFGFRKFGFYVNITLLLIILNVIIFFAAIIIDALTPLNVISMFALSANPFEVITKPWMLITSMFLHAGPIHLLFNMLALFFIGNYLESILGERKFLLTYFVSGLCGGIAFILWETLTGGTIPAVGASGAIFGIFAALAMMRPNLRVFLFPLPIPITLPVAVMIAFFLAFFMFGGMVAHSAHFGGMVSGAVCGYYFRKQSGRQSYYGYGYDDHDYGRW